MDETSAFIECLYQHKVSWGSILAWSCLDCGSATISTCLGLRPSLKFFPDPMETKAVNMNSLWYPQIFSRDLHHLETHGKFILGVQKPAFQRDGRGGCSDGGGGDGKRDGGGDRWRDGCVSIVPSITEMGQRCRSGDSQAIQGNRGWYWDREGTNYDISETLRQ